MTNIFVTEFNETFRKNVIAYLGTIDLRHLAVDLTNSNPNSLSLIAKIKRVCINLILQIRFNKPPCLPG